MATVLLPSRMTAAEYRALQGLPPAGAPDPSANEAGRWGISGSRSTQAIARRAAGELVSQVEAPAQRKSQRKYRNEPVLFEGIWFDSAKELSGYRKLVALRNAVDPAERVERIERQVWFEVIPKQDGERAASYVADFVVHMTGGGRRVIDVKSKATRKLPTYVLKRKLMLQVHGVRIEEW